MKNTQIIVKLIKECYTALFAGRHSAKWNRARKLSLKLHGYKCGACGKSNKLDVHHKNGWAWFKLERFEQHNLIPLCSGRNKCHRQYHKWNGGTRNKCTKASFKKWLKVRR